MYGQDLTSNNKASASFIIMKDELKESFETLYFSDYSLTNIVYMPVFIKL